jgi:hypothetical protein
MVGRMFLPTYGQVIRFHVNYLLCSFSIISQPSNIKWYMPRVKQLLFFGLRYWIVLTVLLELSVFMHQGNAFHDSWVMTIYVTFSFLFSFWRKVLKSDLARILRQVIGFGLKNKNRWSWVTNMFFFFFFFLQSRPKNRHFPFYLGNSKDH